MNNSQTINIDVKNNVLEFTSPPTENAEKLSKKARLFYVGKHKGKQYSKQDLKKIILNFNPDDNIPVQLDHSTSARDTIGRLKKLWLEKNETELHGELEFLGKENVNKVKIGLWKKISVSLCIKKPEMKLIEVSITPFPALEEATIFNNIKHTDTETKEKTNAKQINESNNTQINKQFTQLQQQVEQLKANNFKLEQKIKIDEDTTLVENFVQNGKTTPAMKDTELQLLLSLDEHQRKLFFIYKEIQPQFYELGVKHFANLKKPGEITTEQAEQEARQILNYTSYKENIK